jgi:nucleotidyltransferase substrate binding protein (TIGR01987 family)
MENRDIRWQQRFDNFSKALGLLREAVQKYHEDGLSELEQQGLIQRFEFTHELAWNVLKDYFYYQGSTNINGSRDATREAFQKGLIQDGDQWMAMIVSRNQSTHTYNQDTAQVLVENITENYIHLFEDFHQTMDALLDT